MDLLVGPEGGETAGDGATPELEGEYPQCAPGQTGPDTRSHSRVKRSGASGARRVSDCPYICQSRSCLWYWFKLLAHHVFDAESDYEQTHRRNRPFHLRARAHRLRLLERRLGQE